jgi:hypothetical protein
VSPSSSRSNDKSRNKQTRDLVAGFLLGLFLDPEDGGDKFFRKAERLPLNYRASQLRSLHSSLSPLRTSEPI